MSLSGCWLSVLLIATLTGPVSAFNVYKLGGEDGNAWNTALSFEPGNYAVLNASGVSIATETIASNISYSTWEDTLN